MGSRVFQMTKQAVAETRDTELSNVVSELIDNLSRRNEQASTKLLGSSLGKSI